MGPRSASHLAVLAALQFWAVGVLPAVLAARAAASRYKAWRAQQRREERQRRREQAEASIPRCVLMLPPCCAEQSKSPGFVSPIPC